MINFDKRLIKEIEESSCFGIAYDSEVPECKQCDLTAQCRAKSVNRSVGKSLPVVEVEDSTPAKKTTKKASKKNAPKAKATKEVAKSKATGKKESKTVETAKIPGEMPEFRGMPWEEVQAIAKKYDVEYKDYGNDNITRMRLVMTLKKMYD